MFRQIRQLVVLGFAVSIATPLFAQTPKKYALLVAVTTYEHTHLNQSPKIQFPEADATAIAAELKGSGYEVETLLGTQATRTAIGQKLAGLAKKGNQPGVIVIGFFGHGVEYDEKDADGKQTSRSYFCPYDATMRKRLDEKGKETFDKPGKPRIEPDPTTLISMASVFEAMSLSPAGNRVLLADCCRNDPHAARGRGFGTGIKTGDLPENANTAALFACSKGERAFEDPVSKHGAFTCCVLDWLKKPDGRPTAGSLGEHLDDAVPKLVAKLSKGDENQKPRYLNVGKVDLMLGRDPFIGKTAGEGKELVPEITFHWCPPGDFMMGLGTSVVNVTLTKGFWMGETEVTQGQWHSLMNTTPWKGQEYVKEGFKIAATYISHDDAVAYCDKLTEQERKVGRLSEGWKYALPTEAQWEYACRSGTGTRFSFGDDKKSLGDYGWFVENVDKKKEDYAHEVGLKKPNQWGLKDMHGNVWEWCADWYDAKLPGGRDPVVLSKGSSRVYRGGSWILAAPYCWSAFRHRDSPGGRRSDLGFRVAASSQ